MSKKTAARFFQKSNPASFFGSSVVGTKTPIFVLVTRTDLGAGMAWMGPDARKIMEIERLIVSLKRKMG